MAAENLDTVFINGEFLPSKEAKVSAFDRGFIFGDGIYEVVPVINSRLVDREGFWHRFERSLDQIELKLPYDKEKFEEILYEIISRNALKEGGIYMQITRGAAPRDFYFIENLTPSVFIFCYEASVIDNPLAKSGIAIVSVPDIRWKRRDIKSVSLLAQCYAKNEAHKKGAYEGFMVEDGYVTEGCSSSAFIIKDKTLITKPLSNEILPGIRRKKLLNLAREVGLKVEQRKFSMQEVYDADEAFISAATLILLPVIKADGKLINGGRIGEFAPKLRELYAKDMLKEAGL
ncbi:MULTISPECIES: D-amino-acid transaminase [Campylobacter]|uniref:branched-chain-amino-acid transaminase n=1 Tax=Campylobacter curvus (strain 525.92) TaxID=360105 RepID=A7GYX1_CAMC5|nr:MULTISPECIES: D-amino-acid transaminase [Campylobacter]EAU00298.1 D-amino acid aminotransferase [Campylobacter curvus 525.92]EJP74304.1 putative D-amino-acid transaminase [Campylobacter sp. FOBRC14]